MNQKRERFIPLSARLNFVARTTQHYIANLLISNLEKINL